jgi:hypothetical protein
MVHVFAYLGFECFEFRVVGRGILRAPLTGVAIRLDLEAKGEDFGA